MNDGSAAIRVAGLRHFTCTEPAALELNGLAVASPKARLGRNGIGGMVQHKCTHLNTGWFCGRRIGDSV
jgi:hypothetical protein